MRHEAPVAAVRVPDARGDLVFLVETADALGKRFFMTRQRAELLVLGRAMDAGRIPRGGTIVDVGAHIGTVSIAALAWHGFEAAVSVEAHPGNARLLAANAALNGVAERITHLRFAASDRAGEAVLDASRRSSAKHKIVAEASDAAGEAVPVEVRRLDDVAEIDQGSVRLLWIDVEGHEPEVIRGASRLLERGVPIVLELGHGDAAALTETLGSRYERVVDLRGKSTRPEWRVQELERLASELGERHTHTDVLILPA